MDMSFDKIAAASLLGAISSEKEVSENNYNVGGAICGVALGVGLELLSPTGSLTSAVAAGVVGGLAVAAVKPALEHGPDGQVAALTCFVGGAAISMKAGRIAASYFPG